MTVLRISTGLLLSFALGMAVGIAASRKQVRKAEADVMDALYARHALSEHIRFNREHAARMIA